MFTKTALAALAAALAAASLPAVAGTVGATAETISVRIAYGDLDLRSVAGAKAMVGRIHYAARQACGDEPTDGLDSRGQYRACLERFTAQAVAQLGDPTVAAQTRAAEAAPKVVVAASH